MCNADKTARVDHCGVVLRPPMVWLQSPNLQSVSSWGCSSLCFCHREPTVKSQQHICPHKSARSCKPPAGHCQMVRCDTQVCGFYNQGHKLKGRNRGSFVSFLFLGKYSDHHPWLNDPLMCTWPPLKLPLWKCEMCGGCLNGSKPCWKWDLSMLKHNEGRRSYSCNQQPGGLK